MPIYIVASYCTHTNYAIPFRSLTHISTNNNDTNNKQKEDRIRVLRQRLVEREEQTKPSSDNATAQQTNEIQLQVTTTHLAQGKDAIVVIQPEPTTTSDFDSAIGGGLSIVTRTSQSDCDLSESYL